jgi:hypothetical protein
MPKSKLRHTAFVPRVLLRGAALASVIPACAVAACGSDSTGSTADAGADSVLLGVAAVAYPAYESGAPDARNDARPDVFLGVAAVAYPAYESGAPDGKADAPDGASDAPTRPDVFLGVAAVAYPAYEAGRG